MTFAGTDYLSTACSSLCCRLRLVESNANPPRDSNFPCISQWRRSSSLPRLFAMFTMTGESLPSADGTVWSAALKGLVLLFPSALQISTVLIRCVLCHLQVARARRAIKACQINTWETEQMLIWAVAGRSSFSGGFTANDPHYLLIDYGGECESHTKAISVPLRISRQSFKKKENRDYERPTHSRVTEICKLPESMPDSTDIHAHSCRAHCGKWIKVHQHVHYETHASLSLGMNPSTGEVMSSLMRRARWDCAPLPVQMNDGHN